VDKQRRYGSTRQTHSGTPEPIDGTGGFGMEHVQCLFESGNENIGEFIGPASKKHQAQRFVLRFQVTLEYSRHIVAP
jgi:hypothetical protein